MEDGDGKTVPERLRPSRPRASRWVRVLGLLGLLALAVLSIWWIDRGVGMTNAQAATQAGK